MKKHIMPVLVLSSIAMLSACSSLSYFTQDLQDKYRWSEDELKKIQFYLSRDIVLRRDLSDGSADIVSGRIKVKDGRRVEEVVIRKGTPGAFVFSPKSERFAVCFEEKDDNYLMFGPNPKYSDRYAILASEWNRNSGEVTYAGKKWRVSSDAAYAALMVDLRKITDYDVKSRVVKGRKID